MQAPKEEDAAAHQEFDQFLGNDAGVFAYGDYDEEDKEADEVYAQIEAVMDERRKVRNFCRTAPLVHSAKHLKHAVSCIACLCGCGAMLLFLLSVTLIPLG